MELTGDEIFTFSDVAKFFKFSIIFSIFLLTIYIRVLSWKTCVPTVQHDRALIVLYKKHEVLNYQLYHPVSVLNIRKGWIKKIVNINIPMTLRVFARRVGGEAAGLVGV